MDSLAATCDVRMKQRRPIAVHIGQLRNWGNNSSPRGSHVLQLPRPQCSTHK